MRSLSIKLIFALLVGTAQPSLAVVGKAISSKGPPNAAQIPLPPVDFPALPASSIQDLAPPQEMTAAQIPTPAGEARSLLPGAIFAPTIKQPQALFPAAQNLSESDADQAEVLSRIFENTAPENSAPLIERGISTLASGRGVTWQGRTAIIPLGDDLVLALKTGSSRRKLQYETSMMRSAREFGINAPMPMLVSKENFVARYDGSLAPGHQSKGPYIMPYLMPAQTARSYLTYLNDALPRGSSRAEKEKTIEQAAFRAIDDMAILLRNGYAHQSLAPISHAEAHWEWDYWRWVTPIIGKTRFGPTFVENWRQLLTYPNLRLSGLADFEHVKRLKKFVISHHHPNHGTVSHDVYSAAIGQNLTEWALVVIHSGLINGLSNRQTARIVFKGLERHAKALGAGNALLSLTSSRLSILRALRSTSRRLRLFGAISATTGWALHPLIMRGMKPYIERLRNEGIVASPSLSHPTNWKSDVAIDRCLVLLFSFPLIAGLIFANAFLDKTTNLSTFAGLFSGLLLPPFWVILQGAAWTARVSFEFIEQAIADGVSHVRRFLPYLKD